MCVCVYISSSSPSPPSPSSSSGSTARSGLWPVEQCPSIFSYLSLIISIFSLLDLEDIFLLLLSILSWVFLFVSSPPVLEWRSLKASYTPPFSPGDLTSLSFVPLFILLYFLLYSSLLILGWSYFSILRFHIWDHIFFYILSFQKLEALVLLSSPSSMFPLHTTLPVLLVPYIIEF